MASVQTLSCVPAVIEAGATVRFTVSDSRFPSSLWTLQFILNNGKDAPLIVAATASGTGFIVTLSSTDTASQSPAEYEWAELFTAISPTTEKAYGRTGTLNVPPSIAAQATPTHAQAMVTTLETALSKFAGTANQSVTFNGQTYTRANMGDYQRQLTYWQSRVIAEKRRVAQLRGECGTGGEIRVEFARPRGGWPINGGSLYGGT